MPEIVKCKSCNADIFFVRYKDKYHPVNAKAKKVFVLSDDGHMPALFWEFINGYESHFATCPNAAQHRRKRG